MGEARRRKLLTTQTEIEEGKGKSPVATSGWPLSVRANQDELEAWFTQRKIEFLRPGLHDQPGFLKAEQLDHRALEYMARYVEARSYSELELFEARHKIRIAAEAIAARLARDGRPGKCVIAANSLSRMLDEMGVWNYTAKANVSVRFPPAVGAQTQYFYSVDDGMPETPHAIVVAPPFTVIDLSIRQQAYATRAMRASLPDLIISDVMQAYRPRFKDLMSSEYRARRGIGDDEQQLERHMRKFHADLLEVMEQLPPRKVSFGDGGQIGYAIVGIGGYAEQLHDCLHSNCHLDGLTPSEIFRQDVLPLLGRPYAY